MFLGGMGWARGQRLTECERSATAENSFNPKAEIEILSLFFPRAHCPVCDALLQEEAWV